MTNKNETLVVGLFDSADAAAEAGRNIYEWQLWEEDVDTGAMAVLTADPGSDELRADEIGERSAKAGLGWGTAIGAVAGLLSGGIGLIPGMIIGGAAGAGLGALNHKSVGMTDEQHEKLMVALRGGGAALAIMCDEDEAPAVIGQLKAEGGDVNYYEMQEHVADAIAGAGAAQAAAGQVIDDMTDSLDKDDLAPVVPEIALEVEPEQVRQVSALAVITGLGPVNALKMYRAGIGRGSQFLALAATPAGRNVLAQETDVDSYEIQKAAKRLDLMRIDGVGYREAALLIAAGVDSVTELATRSPGEVHEAIGTVNQAANVMDEAPSRAAVAGWIAQAQELPQMLYL